MFSSFQRYAQKTTYLTASATWLAIIVTTTCQSSQRGVSCVSYSRLQGNSDASNAWWETYSFLKSPIVGTRSWNMRRCLKDQFTPNWPAVLESLGGARFVEEKKKLWRFLELLIILLRWLKCYIFKKIMVHLDIILIWCFKKVEKKV